MKGWSSMTGYVPPEPSGYVQQWNEAETQAYHTIVDPARQNEELARRLGQLAVDHVVRMESTQQMR
jgi:hypothetical protein